MAEKSGGKSKENSSAKFYCENCGTEVGEAESCPKCGSSFEAVRCPKCGLTGTATTFANGCPRCGYAPASEKSAIEKSAAEKAAAVNKSRTYASDPSLKSSLPLWIYIVSGAIFLFSAVATVLANF